MPPPRVNGRGLIESVARRRPGHSFPYFVNGAGGYSLYGFGAPVPGSTVRYNMDHGAMLVEVNRNEAVFRFVTRSGVVVDSFSVAPR